jgi:hypothetical protein
MPGDGRDHFAAGSLNRLVVGSNPVRGPKCEILQQIGQAAVRYPQSYLGSAHPFEAARAPHLRAFAQTAFRFRQLPTPFAISDRLSRVCI